MKFMEKKKIKEQKMDERKNEYREKVIINER